MRLPVYFLLMVLAAMPAGAQTMAVTSVEVRSSWVGFGSPGQSLLRITRGKGNEFRASDGRFIEPGQVEALMHSISDGEHPGPC